MCITRKTGGEWRENVLSSILSNPLVTGKVTHNQEVFPGLHPAIVDEETFAAVQVRLKERGKFRHRMMTSKFLLSGVASCAFCGRHLRARYRDTNGKYYQCSGNEQVLGIRACPGLSKSAPVLDDLVVSRVRQLSQEGVIQKMALEEAERMLKVELVPNQEEHGRLVLELDEIASTFTKWADRLDRGLLDEEQFKLQNSRLLERKRQVQERLKQLEEGLERQHRVRAEYEAVKQALNDFDKLWHVATLEEQQELVRLLVEKLEVSKQAVKLKLRFGAEEVLALPSHRGRREPGPEGDGRKAIGLGPKS